MKNRHTVPEPQGWLRARRALTFAVWLLVGGGLTALVFVVSFYLAMRVEMRSTEVKVPDLTGLTLEAASQRVEPVELVLEVVEQRHDASVPSERVLQQVPPAGASVRRGRKIKLVLSLGGRVLRVPDLVGHAARAVAIELRRDGFTPGFEVRIPSSDVPVGRVLAQVPPADTPAVPNTRVHRLVSAGPSRTAWVMPDLIGLSRRRAEQWAGQAGFRTSVRRIERSGASGGAVVGQFPLAGYPIRSSEVVELTVVK